MTTRLGDLMARLLAQAMSRIPRSKDPPTRPNLDAPVRALAPERPLRARCLREKSGIIKSTPTTRQTQWLQARKSMPKALKSKPIVGPDTTWDTISQSE